MVGIVTNRDMRFASDDRTPVRAMMSSENLAVLREPVDRAEAISLMKRVGSRSFGHGRAGQADRPSDAERHREGGLEPACLQGRIGAVARLLRLRLWATLGLSGLRRLLRRG